MPEAGWSNQRRRQYFGSGGGAEPPGRQKILKNYKNLLKKIAKNALF